MKRFGIEQLMFLFILDNGGNTLLHMYREHFGEPGQDLSGYPFYTDIEKITPIPFVVKPGLEEAYDWDLLLQLAVVEYFTGYKFVFPADGFLPELHLRRLVGDRMETMNVSAMETNEVSKLFVGLFRDVINQKLPEKDSGIFSLSEEKPDEVMAGYNWHRVAAEMEILRRQTRAGLEKFIK
jgi:hypothetical protein